MRKKMYCGVLIGLIAVICFSGGCGDSAEQSTADSQAEAAQVEELIEEASIEPEIASVQEVFRLQNTKELSEAEKRYLPHLD